MFNDILDEHAPIRTFKVRGRPIPCVTENIWEFMKIRDQWRKRAKKTNDLNACAANKNSKREVRNEIRIAEREFINDQIQTIKYKDVWKASG